MLQRASAPTREWTRYGPLPPADTAECWTPFLIGWQGTCNGHWIKRCRQTASVMGSEDGQEDLLDKGIPITLLEKDNHAAHDLDDTQPADDDQMVTLLDMDATQKHTRSNVMW